MGSRPGPECGPQTLFMNLRYRGNVSGVRGPAFYGFGSLPFNGGKTRNSGKGPPAKPEALTVFHLRSWGREAAATD